MPPPHNNELKLLLYILRDRKKLFRLLLILAWYLVFVVREVACALPMIIASICDAFPRQACHDLIFATTSPSLTYRCYSFPHYYHSFHSMQRKKTIKKLVSTDAMSRFFRPVSKQQAQTAADAEMDAASKAAKSPENRRLHT